MAQCVGVLATKPDDTGLILGTHTVERSDLGKLLSLTSTGKLMTHKCTKEFNKGRR